MQDPKKAAQIQQEFRAETDSTIKGEGLQRTRYDKIIRAARADMHLPENVLALVE